MKKLNLICTIAMLGAAAACIAANFASASSGASVTPTNITATVFYLLFWALMTRFAPAAKTSALLALYSMAAGILAICADLGNWASLLTNIITAPAIMMFYGIRFFGSLTMLCVVISVVSFVILIYSLITLANRKPVQVKTEKTEDTQKTEQIAESIDIPETEMIAEAAKYVENINTFENKELEPAQETVQDTLPETADAQ